MWRKCGEIIENLWNLYGILMEKIIDWNMEKLRRNREAFVENRKCGTFVWNRHTGKSKVGKYRNVLRWNGTRNKLEGGKMFRKIADWMNTREGKEVLTGVIFGAVGIFAVRVFCFLVCLATGYPADIWNIF